MACESLRMHKILDMSTPLLLCLFPCWWRSFPLHSNTVVIDFDDSFRRLLTVESVFKKWKVGDTGLGLGTTWRKCWVGLAISFQPWLVKPLKLWSHIRGSHEWLYHQLSSRLPRQLVGCSLIAIVTNFPHWKLTVIISQMKHVAWIGMPVQWKPKGNKTCPVWSVEREASIKSLGHPVVSKLWKFFSVTRAPRMLPNIRESQKHTSVPTMSTRSLGLQHPKTVLPCCFANWNRERVHLV